MNLHWRLSYELLQSSSYIMVTTKALEESEGEPLPHNLAITAQWKLLQYNENKFCHSSKDL